MEKIFLLEKIKHLINLMINNTWHKLQIILEKHGKLTEEEIKQKCDLKEHHCQSCGM